MICDLKIGDHVTDFYILKTAQSKTTFAGKPYLAATLQDCGGMIEAKVWDYTGPVSPADEGKIVKIDGNVSEFKNALQMNVEKIRLATDRDPYVLSHLVPTAPIDTQDAMDRIHQLVDNLADADYQAVCREMLKRHESEFMTIPAAKSVHHGFVGGLLMHTYHMLRLAVQLSEMYGTFLNRDLLLTGTLLHDFAKIQEFTVSELGLVSNYSTKGQLLGHLVMGAQEVAEVAAQLGIPAEKSMLLQHMLLSHHGAPEYGSAVLCQCAEAELLSEIDLIDSRMEIYREMLEKTQPGTFSDRVFALDGKRIYRHE
ncbi:MAG: HD domain-containing protein [Oscillospiraceae bacterium]|nr:HD domain-containing protein [Oscillospiraceae bacterium]